jgi:hypothetical protein
MSAPNLFETAYFQSAMRDLKAVLCGSGTEAGTAVGSTLDATPGNSTANLIIVAEFATSRAAPRCKRTRDSNR